MMIRRLISAGAAILLGVTALFAKDDYALVNVSVACVRGGQGHSKELVSQQLMGYPVKVLSSSGGWSQIETIDGYRGYIINNSLEPVDDVEYDRWRGSRRVIYDALSESKIMESDGVTVVSDVVPGVILEVISDDGDRLLVRLPDGRSGLVGRSDVTDLEQWAMQPFDADKIAGYARACIGTPYLWGGVSSKGMDCSGLTWTAYLLNGRLLRRDASDQARMSDRHISDVAALSPGALIFFGNPSTRRINHVGIVEQSPVYLESSGRVRRSSLDPAAADYRNTSFFFGIDLRDMPPIGDTEASKWLFNK